MFFFLVRTQDAEVRARKVLEDKMSAALTVECKKCKRRFFKDEGCNHMTCPCGQHYCYQCGATLDPKRPYAHFGEGMPVRI